MATFTMSATAGIVDDNYSLGQLTLREAMKLANATTAAYTI